MKMNLESFKKKGVEVIKKVMPSGMTVYFLAGCFTMLALTDVEAQSFDASNEVVVKNGMETSAKNYAQKDIKRIVWDAHESDLAPEGEEINPNLYTINFSKLKSKIRKPYYEKVEEGLENAGLEKVNMDQIEDIMKLKQGNYENLETVTFGEDNEKIEFYERIGSDATKEEVQVGTWLSILVAMNPDLDLDNPESYNDALNIVRETREMSQEVFDSDIFWDLSLQVRRFENEKKDYEDILEKIRNGKYTDDEEKEIHDLYKSYYDRVHGDATDLLQARGLTQEELITFFKQNRDTFSDAQKDLSYAIESMLLVKTIGAGL